MCMYPDSWCSDCPSYDMCNSPKKKRYEKMDDNNMFFRRV